MSFRWIFIILSACVRSASQTITSKSRIFPPLLLVLFLLTALAAAQVQPLTAWWIDTGDTDSTGLGTGMAPLGDINGDGYDDFVTSGNYYYYHGKLYVYYGSSQPDTVPHMVIPSPNPDLPYFGLGLFSVGDVNGDGYLDFIAPGEVQDFPPTQQYSYLYLGGPLLDTIPNVTFKNESEQQSGQFGYEGAGLGDVNGDGFNDFAITDRYYAAGGSNEGAIYIYYGGNPPDSIPDVIIHADNMMNHIGWCIAPLGDVNHDGYADIVMSDPDYGIPGVSAENGVIAIYYGGNPPDTIPEFMTSGSPGSMLGLALTTIDWNRDGQLDIFSLTTLDYGPGYSSIWEFNVSPEMTGWPDHVFIGQTTTSSASLGHVDLNGDNLQDLMFVNSYFGVVYLFLNGNYSDTLYDAYYFAGDYTARSFCDAGDTDGDGIHDLALGQGYAGYGRVHLIKGNSSLHQSPVSPNRPPALLEFIPLSASPNPFNPSTTLSYELPAASQVKLTVWDTAGRLICSLLHERQLPGEHTITFDGSDLPSGLYLARLSAGTMTTTRKLVLLK